MESLTSADLKGKWIDTETRLDTLVFEPIETSEIFNLKRGKEILNGHLLPKSGSGPYYYNLDKDKISLRWMLSSNSNYEDYYIEIIENKMNIGNFYGSTSGDTLAFEKLE